ncbi:MAG TPA: TetR/AcrR family transcriptional regulator [Stellaceae bacterium]|nr:TetR/AcrR family transcriptional regulator [Stellaceae bacterium]
MAKRPTGSKAKAKPATPRDRILDAALALSERSGWRGASLGAIAGEADMPLHEVYAEFRSRSAIIAGLMARTDEQVLAGTAAPDAEETPRDRLFEVLMRRFDALKPHRAALKAIARDLLTDPPLALCATPALMRSMAWTLEAAGLSSAGPRGRFHVRAIAALYLCVSRTFLDDDTADLSKTMAALDRRLSQAEPWLGLAGLRWGGSREKQPA